MSSKAVDNANAAQTGAQNLGSAPNPNPQDPPVMPCQKKHWIGVRVVDENGKPVKGVQVKIKLTDGTTTDITIDKSGSYKTAKVLPPGNCEISLPKIYDPEWKPQ